MEIWKTIEGFENYQVSNLGNVKSLQRFDSLGRNVKEKLLKKRLNADGYEQVNLCGNGIQKTKQTHQLVASAFLGHISCGHEIVVNHKDFNRRNNLVDNLELITQRENSNRKHRKSTSKFTGVCWYKESSKWMACITIDGKSKHLGYFKDEYDAHLAYENKLKDITKNH